MEFLPIRPLSFVLYKWGHIQLYFETNMESEEKQARKKSKGREA